MTYWAYSNPEPPVYSRKKRALTCGVVTSRDAAGKPTFCTFEVDRGEWICQGHVDNLLDDLREVGDLVEDLDVAFTRMSRTTERQGGSKSAETALPYDPRASRVKAKLIGDLTRWAGFITEELGDCKPWPACTSCEHQSCCWARAPRPADDRPATVALWLVDQIRYLKHQRAGASFAGVVATRVDDARTATDLPDTWEFNVGPCPELVDNEPCAGVIRAHIHAIEPSVLQCTSCGKEYRTWQWARASQRITKRKAAVS